LWDTVKQMLRGHFEVFLGELIMAKQMIDTPNLDQLESGPWPSFVTGG